VICKLEFHPVEPLKLSIAEQEQYISGCDLITDVLPIITTYSAPHPSRFRMSSPVVSDIADLGLFNAWHFALGDEEDQLFLLDSRDGDQCADRPHGIRHYA
jgi:hypothetical protein